MAPRRKLILDRNGDEEKQQRIAKVDEEVSEKISGSDSDGEEEGKKRSRGSACLTKKKVFTNGDAIALLEGLHRFWANGKNNKWSEFHRSIVDKLSTQFTKVQVSEKIRSLKKKFESNRERGRVTIDFSDPHESVVFELSKSLWGEQDVEEEALKKSRGKRKLEQEEKGVDDDDKNEKETWEGFKAAYPHLYASFDDYTFLKKKCILIPSEKAKEFEEKWKELHVEALRIIKNRKLGRL